MHHLVGPRFKPPGPGPCLASCWLLLVLGIGCLPDGSHQNRERPQGPRFGTSDFSIPEPGTVYPTTTDTEGFGPEDVSVSLSATGLTLTLREPPGAMLFGMIETGSCADDCWLAEGCVEATDGISVCHETTPSGLTLRTVTDSAAVVASETTRISDVFEGRLTFMLAADDACYTWGTTPGYYINAMGCSVW